MSTKIGGVSFSKSTHSDDVDSGKQLLFYLVLQCRQTTRMIRLRVHFCGMYMYNRSAVM